MYKPTVNADAIRAGLVKLSSSGLDVNPLAALLAKMVDDYARLGQEVTKQARTIARLEERIESLQQSNQPGE